MKKLRWTFFLTLSLFASGTAVRAERVVGPTVPVSELVITRESVRADPQLGVRCVTGTIGLRGPGIFIFPPQANQPEPVYRIGAFVEIQPSTHRPPPPMGRYLGVVGTVSGSKFLVVSDSMQDDERVEVGVNDTPAADPTLELGPSEFAFVLRKDAAPSESAAQFIVGEELKPSGCGVLGAIDLAEEVEGNTTRRGVTPLAIRFYGSIDAGQYRREPPLEEAKSVVVNLRNAKRQSIGAGIVLGMRRDRLYIMTAQHVVWSYDEPLSGVRASFFSAPGETFPVDVLDLCDEKLDLALVAIPSSTPGLPRVQELRRGDGSRLKTGSNVRSIGHPQGVLWRVAGGQEKFSRRVSSMFQFESVIADEGSSGGGLFDSCGGLVGMVTHAGNGLGVAVPVDRLLEKLAEWTLEFNLSPSVQCFDEQ